MHPVDGNITSVAEFIVKTGEVSQLQLLDLDNTIKKVGLSILDPNQGSSPYVKALNGVVEYFFGSKDVKVSRDGDSPLYIKIDDLRGIISDDDIARLERGDVSVLHHNCDEARTIDEFQELARENEVKFNLNELLPISLSEGVLGKMKKSISALREKTAHKSNLEEQLQTTKKEMLIIKKEEESLKLQQDNIENALKNALKEKETCIESIEKLKKDSGIKELEEERLSLEEQINKINESMQTSPSQGVVQKMAGEINLKVLNEKVKEVIEELSNRDKFPQIRQLSSLSTQLKEIDARLDDLKESKVIVDQSVKSFDEKMKKIEKETTEIENNIKAKREEIASGLSAIMNMINPYGEGEVW